MNEQLPTHKVVRDGVTSVYMLYDAVGDKVAAFSTRSLAPMGGVFCLVTGKGWTREMADKAFRVYLGGKLT